MTEPKDKESKNSDHKMIEIQGLYKSYNLGEGSLQALGGIDLKIERGEFVTIMGASGSGKSTLLHVIGILDAPSEGSYLLEGHEILRLPDREQARIRNRHFGFVFQSFNLFGELNALENVCLPMTYAGLSPRVRRSRAAELLERVGLTRRRFHFPNMLSGGEQQRVAIARALANEPDLVLADEPTGNLPTDTGGAILDLFKEMNDAGTTIVMVTHDEKIAARGSRQIRLSDGKIAEDSRSARDGQT